MAGLLSSETWSDPIAAIALFDLRLDVSRSDSNANEASGFTAPGRSSRIGLLALSSPGGRVVVLKKHVEGNDVSGARTPFFRAAA